VIDCTDEQLMEEVRRRGFVIRDAKIGREWAGLTDEDKEGIKNKATYNWDTTAGEYASEVQALTEAKLKEKNGG
jgi:hypothetical protein